MAEPPARPPQIVVCTILLLVLGALSYRQSHAYRDMETLWRTTISTNPDSAMANNNLGLLLFERGSIHESMYYLERAVQLDPRNAEAHNNFGNALRAQGRLNQAIAQYRQAVELLPKFVLYRANLASALTGVGRLDEAITHYEEAVKAAPSDAFIANNLAWLLATGPEIAPGSGERAVELAERAVELSRNNPIHAGTLAAAYAAAGRFEDAAAQAERARDLAVQQGNRDIVDLLTEMLTSYRMGKIYR